MTELVDLGKVDKWVAKFGARRDRFREEISEWGKLLNVGRVVLNDGEWFYDIDEGQARPPPFTEVHADSAK